MTAKGQDTVRVYFRVDDVLRPFCWVATGSDGSVYFGSSSSRLPTRLHGFIRHPSGRTHVNPKLLGRPMSVAEISGKHSWHATGAALLPIVTDGRRVSYPIPTIAGHDAIPLVAVLPMDITRYKGTRRVPRETDIVIQADPWLGQPFAALLYVKRPDRPTPAVVQALTAWDRFTAYSSRLGDLELCVALCEHDDVHPLARARILGHCSTEGRWV